MMNSYREEKVRRAHLFIINPRSFRFTGGPEEIVSEIHAYFQNSGQEGYHIHVSRYPRDAMGVIREFAASVREGVIIRVYAVGGDGILFDCLNGIVGMANTELAVMPYGSSNDFVRSFGGDKAALFCDIEKQVSAGTVKTDILYCGSNYAINFCSVGVESVAVMYAMRFMKAFGWVIRLSRRIVPLLYAIGGVFAVLDKRTREQRYRISLDGECADGNYTTINFANGPYYGGGMSAVADAMPNDGFLDALLLRSESALRILKMFPRYLRGGYYWYPGFFSYRRVRKVEISSDMPIPVNLDGEMFFDTHLTLEVIPQAVDIVAVDGLTYERKPDARKRR
jgi:diacylglycerol kinase family enzyme